MLTHLLAPAGEEAEVFHTVDYSGDFERNQTDSFDADAGFSGSPDNTLKFTLSVWVMKESGVPTAQNYLMHSGMNGSSDQHGRFCISVDERLMFWRRDSGGMDTKMETTMQLAQSTWYHCVCQGDLAQATAANRIKIWIDGDPISSWATNDPPPQNNNMYVNGNNAMYVGQRGDENSNFYMDGRIAEMYLIDGILVDPTEFANDNGGTWTPKQYTGPFGNNGYYLEFKVNGDLGRDTSGNNNDFSNLGVSRNGTTPPN